VISPRGHLIDTADTFEAMPKMSATSFWSRAVAPAAPHVSRPGWRPCRLVLYLAWCLATAAAAQDRLGREFLGFDDFAAFRKTTLGTELVLTSPQLHSYIAFKELIASWNAEVPQGAYLAVEARILYDHSTTKFFKLGVWSKDSALQPQTSVPDQTDADGQVSTDTLLVQRPGTNFQLRLTLGGRGETLPRLKYLGVSLCRPDVSPPDLPPNRAAWGVTLPVVERSQMAYPDGKVLCSPTTVSMLMSFWAKRLSRPELDRPVPDVAAGVYDLAWKGTGNWCFNMAYAGAWTGMRAYVTRLGDLAEVETWIAAGIPVGLSVDYDRLRAKGPGPNGHLVVCVGFTDKGDVVINDPGTSQHVRKIFARTNVIDAWSCSHNTAYIIHPENVVAPADPFGHWDSPKTRYKR
jgi:hypothetical protein